MKLPLYKSLYQINSGFDRVERGIAAFRKHPEFQAHELDQHSTWAREVRACINSYLLEVLERLETDEAAKLARKSKRLSDRTEDL